MAETPGAGLEAQVRAQMLALAAALQDLEQRAGTLDASPAGVAALARLRQTVTMLEQGFGVLSATQPALQSFAEARKASLQSLEARLSRLEARLAARST